MAILSTDKINFLLDADGDLDLSGGQLNLSSGAEAVRQGAAQRVQFFRGEWFLDESVGVDWFGKILRKAPNLAEVRDEIRSAVLATPAITGVSRIVVEKPDADRTTSITWQAASAFGDVPSEAEVPL